jgi:hypothetical protein
MESPALIPASSVGPSIPRPGPPARGKVRVYNHNPAGCQQKQATADGAGSELAMVLGIARQGPARGGTGRRRPAGPGICGKSADKTGGICPPGKVAKILGKRPSAQRKPGRPFLLPPRGGSLPTAPLEMAKMLTLALSGDKNHKEHPGHQDMQAKGPAMGLAACCPTGRHERLRNPVYDDSNFDPSRAYPQGRGTRPVTPDEHFDGRLIATGQESLQELAVGDSRGRDTPHQVTEMVQEGGQTGLGHARVLGRWDDLYLLHTREVASRGAPVSARPGAVVLAAPPPPSVPRPQASCLWLRLPCSGRDWTGGPSGFVSNSRIRASEFYSGIPFA